MKTLPLLLISIFSFANELQQQLLDDIKAQKTEYSALEMVLIAEGVASHEKLAEYNKRYETLLNDLALSPKQAKQGSKKKAKNLHASILGELTMEQQAGFVKLIDMGICTPVTAALVYADMSQKAAVASSDWVGDNLDPHFAAGGTLEEIASAHLAAYAAGPEPKDEDRPAIMEISIFLAPQSTYGVDRFDRQLYDMGLDAFNAGHYLKAAHVVLAGSSRFPAQTAFAPLAFNTGIKLLQTEGEEADLLRQATRLQAVMGAHQKDFDTVIETHNYNKAAELYNEKKYAQAMVALEKVVNPPDAENYRKVLGSTYAWMAEDLLNKGETERGQAVLAKLEKLDGERASLLKQRMEQLKLKEMVDSGDLEKALAQAAVKLDNEIDRNNYRSVLVRLSQALRQSGKFEKAMALLTHLPEKAQIGQTANNLRFNTYTDWVESHEPEDYKTLLPLYKRIFSDKQLTMTKENDDAYRTNYGLLYYQEITVLIEDRNFKEAERRSREALAIAPSHPDLLEQRKLVDTIMKRISN